MKEVLTGNIKTCSNRYTFTRCIQTTSTAIASEIIIRFIRTKKNGLKNFIGHWVTPN